MLLLYPRKETTCNIRIVQLIRDTSRHEYIHETNGRNINTIVVMHL